MNDAERKRLRRAGMVSIVLWVDRLWAAEALAQAGYGHADADSREAVRAAAQEHLDDMIEAARGGNVPRGTSGEFVIALGSREFTDRNRTPRKCCQTSAKQRLRSRPIAQCGISARSCFGKCEAGDTRRRPRHKPRLPAPRISSSRSSTRKHHRRRRSSSVLERAPRHRARARDREQHAGAVFDRMMPFMVQVPLRSRVIINSSSITGASAAEAAAKPVRRLNLSNLDTELTKSIAQVAMSKELLDEAPELAQVILSRALPEAVGRATDTFLLSKLNANNSGESTGDVNPTWAQMLADLVELLEQVQAGDASKLFFIMPPRIAKALSGKAYENGVVTAKYNGGEILGVPILTTLAQTAGMITIADASRDRRRRRRLFGSHERRCQPRAQRHADRRCRRADGRLDCLGISDKHARVALRAACFRADLRH